MNIACSLIWWCVYRSVAAAAAAAAVASRDQTHALILLVHRWLDSATFTLACVDVQSHAWHIRNIQRLLSLAAIMADLPVQVVQQRRDSIANAILAFNAINPGYDYYAMVCPCDINCGHMPEDEIPRIMLSQCYYPGEYDYFFVKQPFFETHKFKVRWHCDECHAELCCATPFPH